MTQHSRFQRQNGDGRYRRQYDRYRRIHQPGLPVARIDSPFVLMSLWVVGGCIALSGAFSYAELGAAIPRSGGEYHFLSTIIHPSVGFVSGWISATLGFAGPVALAGKTFAAYASSSLPFLDTPLIENTLAIVLILMLALTHSVSHRTSGFAQQAFTAIKIGIIVIFCIAALALGGGHQPVSFLPAAGDFAMFGTAAYAVSLMYVSYAYTGWNAATYVTSELANPQRSLPGALLAGTLIVTLLYVALNAVFLMSAPASALRGEPEIGFIVAQFAFGDTGARLTGLILALLLVSTVRRNDTRRAAGAAGDRSGLPAVRRSWPHQRRRRATACHLAAVRAGLPVVFLVQFRIPAAGFGLRARAVEFRNGAVALCSAH